MSRTFYVGFDTAHKERGKISTNYKSLASHLNANGFACSEYAEFPITRQNIAPYDIVVFACPDFSKISPQEIEAIQKWVKEDGGGLLLLSHAGGDKGRRSNLSELAERFGMIFENDQVLDSTSNLGVENLPVITQFGFPHPITEGINSLCFRAGCSLTNTRATNSVVVSSGPNADPFETPLILAGEDGEGRIVACGSYEMFRDKIAGGITHESHAQLILNIMNWLKTTRREQIRAGTVASSSQQPSAQLGQNTMMGAPPSLNAASGMIQQPIANNATNSTTAATTATPLITYESNVKIATKEDLLRAFEDSLAAMISFKERMLAEFDVLMQNTQNLIKAIAVSEEEMVVLKAQAQSAMTSVGETSSPTTNSSNTSTSTLSNSSAPADNVATLDPQLNSILSSLANIEKQQSEEAAIKKSELENQQSTAAASTSVSLNHPAGLSPPPGLTPPIGTVKGVSSESNASQQSVADQTINTLTSLEPDSQEPTPLTGADLPSLTPLPPKPGESYIDSGYSSTPSYVGSMDSNYSAPTDYSSTYSANDSISSQGYENLATGESIQQETENIEKNTEMVKPAKKEEKSGLTKSKEELEAELEALQNKLNSIKNLRAFVEKKFQDGKLKKSGYDKQMKKLDNDTNKTKFRIEEIEGILKKMN